MTRSEKIIWSAGIIDGEGYVGIEVNTKTKRPTRPVIDVTNTDMKILNEFKNLYGGPIYDKTRPNRPRSKPCWAWRITGRACIEAARVFRPFLVSKAEKADLILSFYEK